ncbi:UNVERIFIED_CONTAM: hypothetical protein H355_015513, partial [Colinus virginianus]
VRAENNKVTVIMTTIRQRKGGKVPEADEDQPSDEKNVKSEGKNLNDHTGGKLWNILSLTVGGIVAISLGLLTSVYIATLHENDLWFSNIKEVEREISFRTECGLYYSYYKQMIQAASIQQGIVNCKKILNLESDEHIFKFLKAKFGFGATRDFDAKLYLCEEAFGLLPLNTFSRLSDTLLFYVYIFILIPMTITAVIVALRNLR